MRIVCISDTHNQHHEATEFLPKGDLIIHAGDVSGSGTESEIKNFLDWFDSLDFKYKIFIPGNHDFFFDYEWYPRTLVGKIRHKGREGHKEIINNLLAKYPKITYLNDSFVEIEGIKIFGSPVTPWFHDWAFNRYPDEIIKHWNLIPKDVDILVTHGPAHNILDKTEEHIKTGCVSLLEKILEVKPKIHICGHIHEAYGTYIGVDTTFINASLLNRRYQLTNPAISINI